MKDQSVSLGTRQATFVKEAGTVADLVTGPSALVDERASPEAVLSLKILDPA